MFTRTITISRGFIHTRKSPSFLGNDAAANKLWDTIPRGRAAAYQQWDVQISSLKGVGKGRAGSVRLARGNRLLSSAVTDKHSRSTF